MLFCGDPNAHLKQIQLFQCVLLSYLFNACEGTLRFCTEHKIKLRKVSEIFLTSLSPYEVGGLPGLMLTLADCGVRHINVAGPPNLLQYLQSMRSFMKRYVVKEGRIFNFY